MPCQVANPVETRIVQPAPKRSVVFEPMRHLLHTFMPSVVALAPVRVAAVVITAVSIATIIVGMTGDRQAILSALLSVGCCLGRFQEQQTTG